MPTYEYRCSKCGEDFEVYQSFSEDPLKKHAACGGKLTKVLSSVGIVLKGSGFYKTDNRSASGRAKAREDSGASSSSDSSSSSNGSDSKSSDSSKADSGSSGDSSKPKSGSSNGEKSGGDKSNGSKSPATKKTPAKSA
jgi:putative FmdB family regulatory protein